MDDFNYTEYMETAAENFINDGGTAEDMDRIKGVLFNAIKSMKEETPSEYQCWNAVRQKQINALYVSIGILERKFSEIERRN